MSFNIDAGHPTPLYHQLERTGIVETRRGVGTFVKARQFEAAREKDRQRELRELEDHFLSRAAHLGFSAEEALDHLKDRLRRKL